MKVIIHYPVKRFNTIKVEMSEQEFIELKNKTCEDKAIFISQCNDKLKSPEVVDEREIEGALEVDYAYIKKAAT